MARRRITWIIAGVLCGFVVISGRLIWLQGFQWRDYAALEESLRCPLRYLPAARGRILARGGEVLAEDLPHHTFHYTLKALDPIGTIASTLARRISIWDRELADGFTAEVLKDSLEKLRGLYRERLGGPADLPPHPWIGDLDAPLVQHLTQWLKKADNRKRLPGVSVTVDEEGGTIWIDPDAAFAAEAGTIRLERKLGLPHGSLFAGTFGADGVRTGIEARLARVRKLVDRDAQRRGLEMERDLFHELPARLRPDTIPFDIVVEVASHAERYPGIRVRESLRRRYSRCESVGNLVGFAEPVARRVEAEEERAKRRRGSPDSAAGAGEDALDDAETVIVLDERRGSSARLARLRDLHTFRELRSEGYLWRDSIGARGVEAAFERQLHGLAGAVQQELDQQEVPVGIPRDGEAPITGGDVTLSIDLALSEFVQAQMVRLGVVAGSALIGVPKSGEILAWITVPGYDPATLHRDWEEIAAIAHLSPLLNRPAQAELPPGSTIKVAFALGALAEGLVDRDSTYTCTGVYDPRFPDTLGCNNHSARLPLTLGVTEALARSCNCYFYHLGGKRMGIDRMRETLVRFGFGSPTGVDLLGERTGDLPAAWPEVTAIGQGQLTTTPLQLFRFFSAIANRGAAPSPTVTIAASRTEPPQISFDPTALDTVIDGMVQAVEYGTASDADIGLHAFSCAAKTGTAQWDAGRENTNIGWIAGFAPVIDPEIVFVIEVEHTELHGGHAAGPIAASVLEWLTVERQYRFETEKQASSR